MGSVYSSHYRFCWSATNLTTVLLPQVLLYSYTGTVAIGRDSHISDRLQGKRSQRSIERRLSSMASKHPIVFGLVIAPTGLVIAHPLCSYFLSKKTPQTDTMSSVDECIIGPFPLAETEGERCN